MASALRIRSARIGISLAAVGLIGLTGAGSARADEAKPAAAPSGVVVGQPAGVTLAPEKIVLAGQRSRQQIIATGQYANSEVRDLTPAVEFESTAPQIARIEKGVV